MKKLLLSVAICVSLSSCAALTRYKCNREYAAKKGMEDAAAGLTSMPSRLDGSSCEGDYSPSSFSKDYAAGFQQKKQEVCQLPAATAYGHADGEAGLGAKPQRAKLQLCSDLKEMKKLEAAYDGAFKKTYCSTGRAAKAGIARAQAWQAADLSGFADCGTAVKKPYMDAYNSTLADNCSVAEAQRLGVAEATAKRPMGEGNARLSICKNKTALVEHFEKAYVTTQERVGKEEAARVAAEQERLRAEKAAAFHANTATSAFPYQLRSYVSRCQVAGDRSYVQVEVENRYPEQVLIQGNWKVLYYNGDFNKITEDRTTEAVLVTGNNKKTFQKLTLPRDAAYCRAEFVGQ